MNVVVRKVMCQKDMDDFVRLPRRLYQGVKQYVPDLESEIADIVRRKNKPGMEFSNVQPFVAYQGQVPVGRIVGIINHKANERWNERVVRFGLIEFIDNQDVSRALLEAVERWGRVMDMDTIQGPLGITDFDKEGMLVEDFHLPGTMNTIWNPDYYPRHMATEGCRLVADTHSDSAGSACTLQSYSSVCTRTDRVAGGETEPQGPRQAWLRAANFPTAQ